MLHVVFFTRKCIRGSGIREVGMMYMIYKWDLATTRPGEAEVCLTYSLFATNW